MEPPPAAAAEVFGTSLPLAERYADWLAGAGVERGLLGPREVDRIWTRHLLNCAALEPITPTTGSICDLGSGAGLPGLVLAILRPTQRVTLLEPLLRRATFLQEVTADLGLRQVEVVRDRAEDYSRRSPDHDVVVARAVAPLSKLLGWSLPLLRPGGTLLALKGENAAVELSDAAHELHRQRVVDAEVVTCEGGGTVTHVVRVTCPDDLSADPAPDPAPDPSADPAAEER